jgi:hypothetical protein
MEVRMSKKKKLTESMVARFPEGSFARIAAVLGEFEDRADLVRDAVMAEVRKRERAMGISPRSFQDVRAQIADVRKEQGLDPEEDDIGAVPDEWVD